MLLVREKWNEEYDVILCEEYCRSNFRTEMVGVLGTSMMQHERRYPMSCCGTGLRTPW